MSEEENEEEPKPEEEDPMDIDPEDLDLITKSDEDAEDREET